MPTYKINRIHRDESDLNIKITFPTGKSIIDIIDAKFLVKTSEAAALGTALISKTLVNTDIVLVNPNIAKVSFAVTDYDNITIGTIYKAAFFCKWTGNNDYDENVESIFDFETIQNFDNNN